MNVDVDEARCNVEAPDIDPRRAGRNQARFIVTDAFDPAVAHDHHSVWNRAAIGEDGSVEEDFRHGWILNR
jgi:hypothetical protein